MWRAGIDQPLTRALKSCRVPVQEQARVWMQAGEYMAKEDPTGNAALEMEFRRLLGASQRFVRR